MKEFGIMIKEMEVENIIMEMEIILQDFGKMELKLEQGNYMIKMEIL